MNLLYQSIGITKQSFHQYMERLGHRRNEELQLLQFIYDIREDHPTLGLRDLYYKIQPACMGRDAFEMFCKKEGLGSKRKINYCRTTNSTGVERFLNLIEDLKITTINQVGKAISLTMRWKIDSIISLLLLMHIQEELWVTQYQKDSLPNKPHCLL